MNTARNSRSRFALGVVGLFGAFSLVPNSNASVSVTLTDNNSQVSIDPTSQAGVFDWTVDTQNYLSQQWFWYRVGQTAEQSIDTLTLLDVQQPNPSQATLVYRNSTVGFDLSVSYTLDGGALWSGNADLSEQVQIDNYSGANLDFHLFLYSDFALGGTAGGDTVSQLFGSPIGYISATQVEGGDLNQTTVSRGGDRIEASLGDSTLIKLNNGVADVLDNTSAPLGPGDANYTFQWDQTIGNGSSFLVTVDKRLDITPIPEPTATALALMSMAVLIRRLHRRQS